MSENALKPLKEACRKILTARDEKGCHEQFDVLQMYVNKQRAYEFHTFSVLLDLLTENPKLDEWKSTAVAKFMKVLLQQGTNNKDAIVVHFYNFINKLQDRHDLIEPLFIIGRLDNEPLVTKARHMVLISRQLSRLATTEEHRGVIYFNQQMFLQAHGMDKDLLLAQLEAISFVVQNNVCQNRLDVSECLQKTLLQAADEKKLKISGAEQFNEIFKMIKFIEKLGKSSAKNLLILSELSQKLSAVTTDNEYKKCFEILSVTFKVLQQSRIDSDALGQLHRFYSSTKNEQPITTELSETTTLLLKILSDNMNLSDGSGETFLDYHNLVYSLFFIIKEIPSEPGKLSCCSDLKRHEVFNAVFSVMHMTQKVVKEKNFDVVIGKKVLFHVRYAMQIMDSIKCSDKITLLRNFYARLFNTLHMFMGSKAMIADNLSCVIELIQILLKARSSIIEDFGTKTENPEALIWRIFEEADSQSTSVECTNAMLSAMNLKLKETGDYFNATNEVKRSVMKKMIFIRETVMSLKFPCVASYMESKSFVDLKFADDFEIDIPTILVIEICAISRYLPAEKESLAALYKTLLKSSADATTIAEACQVISDSTIKSIGCDSFKNVIKLLEKLNEPDIRISLALGFINYEIYFSMFEETKGKLKQDVLTAIEKVKLQEELDQLKYLNESLKHFTDVVHHLIQRREDIEKIPTMNMLQIILENTANQYFMRGIKYKDLETFSLLWRIVIIDGKSLQILPRIATFFLDHRSSLTDLTGNYIKLSKTLKPLTLDEIVSGANKVLDDEIVKFSERTAADHSQVLSYLLSLCVYLYKIGRNAEGRKRYNQFEAMSKLSKIPKDSSTHDILQAKFYFSAVEINLKVFNKCADNFLSIAVSTLLGTKSIDRDFMHQFYQIFYRTILKAVGYSVNRLADMDHYEKAVLSLIVTVAKKNHCLKLMDILSLSISRYLDMEKTNKAMAQLKTITNLLGLKDEILMESPAKAETVSTIFDFDAADIGIRKVAQKPASPVESEISLIYEDQDSQLSRQLKTFVHKISCKCEICKTPKFKFLMFQIGCHYSRLMWLNGKFEISDSFNSFVLEPWRNMNDKLRRVKDSEFLMINKKNFAVFSIRWLFQCADTLLKLGKYSEVEEIYQEIELLNTPNLNDHHCFNQLLYTRKENLNFILEQGLLDKPLPNAPPSFAKFLNLKEGSTKNLSFKSPEATGLASSMKTPASGAPLKTSAPVKSSSMKTPALKKKPALMIVTPAPKSKEESVIFIDSSDEEPSVVAKKTRTATRAATAVDDAKPSATKKAAVPTKTPKRVTRKNNEVDNDLRDTSTEPLRKARRRMI